MFPSGVGVKLYSWAQHATYFSDAKQNDIHKITIQVGCSQKRPNKAYMHANAPNEKRKEKTQTEETPACQISDAHMSG